MLLSELPLEGEIWSRRGSMNGVKDEEDLCLDMELLSDWDWQTRMHLTVTNLELS